jgi:hypothetical protein
MIKNIISRLTMMKVGKTFYDFHDKQTVHYWQDCYFDIYLANNRFGNRIKINRL